MGAESGKVIAVQHCEGGDSKCAAWVRRLTWFASLAIACSGMINAISAIRATAVTGFTMRITFDVTTFSLANHTQVQDLGFTTAGSDIIGVQVFGIFAVLVGGCLWKRIGWWQYFVLSFAGLIGQAACPPVSDVCKQYFFFGSNFFEIVSFG